MQDNPSPQAADTAQPATGSKILVWDLPVRILHWLLVASFAGAWLTAESDQWQLLHITLGYTVLGLAAFRIAWGVLGTRYARFSSFVHGPSAIGRYLGSLARGKPQHCVGHNPAGALAILTLLLLSVAVGISGWATYATVGGEAYEDIHEALATAMLVVAGLHVVGVIAGSWLHRENLVAAMITGRKRGAPGDGIRRNWDALGVLLLAAVLGFWWWQLQHPASGLAHPEQAAGNRASEEGDGD